MPSCTFIGHRDCPEKIKSSLRNVIEELIIKENVDTFYVGTQGKFDCFVYEVLCDLEREYNIKVIVVLAYLESRETYYDSNKTIFPHILESTPKRYAINKRNQYMIKKSQYIICYVNNTFSNAFAFLDFASKHSLNIINLGEYKKS